MTDEQLMKLALTKTRSAPLGNDVTDEQLMKLALTETRSAPSGTT